ncbi:MAG: hypothetical protein WBF42_09855, partial [Terracidiphilus sp.]
FHVAPNGAQCKEEGAVHHTFKMCGETHPHIRKMLLCKSRKEPKHKQTHPMKHQTSIGSLHGRDFLSIKEIAQAQGVGSGTHSFELA